LEVIDKVIRRDLPQGPCWRRYNYDGYGQKKNGQAFDGSGIGRAWPILTGERGHYELAAGKDPLPYIRSLEDFANAGGMLSEQLWDEPALPDGSIKPGDPTGAAMPLCWSHAEYVSLVRSRADGVPFDLLPPVRDRYVTKRTTGHHEYWSFRHPLRHIPSGKVLRLVLNASAKVIWSTDGWKTKQESETALEEALGIWHLDLDTVGLPVDARVDFTFLWTESKHWEGRNWQVAIS
ncbi:MAG: glycoside hydrolase family 15 protein, partial [Verrucomicrobium sp.]|nr:glycoside hydrolase family 15 protein [Verrucomicrobium sp.]